MTNNTHIIAITRAIPARIADCELTFQSRVPIDIERARSQHAEYQRVLAKLGCEIVELPEEPNMPDSVFVEDTAVVFEELAIITRPGAESRRAEIPTVRTALARYRALHEIAGNGTLDGGDVLRLGRRVFVGLSTRTNAEGVAQMRSILREYDYDVVGVAVKGKLHLKSVATAIAEDLVVVDPNAIDPASFGTRYLEVAGDAANMLRVNDTVLAPATAARFAGRLAAEGFNVELIDNSELAKAEGALTCCSLIFNEWRD